jgi:hypothetical protein
MGMSKQVMFSSFSFQHKSLLNISVNLDNFVLRTCLDESNEDDNNFHVCLIDFGKSVPSSVLLSSGDRFSPQLLSEEQLSIQFFTDEIVHHNYLTANRESLLSATSLRYSGGQFAKGFHNKTKQFETWTYEVRTVSFLGFLLISD